MIVVTIARRGWLLPKDRWDFPPREAWDAHRELLDDVREDVAALPPGTVVIHGGADGVDKTAGEAAVKAGHKVIVVAAWWDAWASEAPKVRNVYNCAAPVVRAYPGPMSRGTRHAIGLAKAAGCDVVVREPSV